MTQLKHHRYPKEVIQYAMYLFQVHQLSLRDTALLLKANRIDVSYKTVYEWVNKFSRNFKYSGKDSLFDKNNAVFEEKVLLNGKKCKLFGLRNKKGLVISLAVIKNKGK